jgi:signal transduction histidine kinase
MLVEFILTHREELIARARGKVANRLAPRPTDLELASGVPLFLEQLAETLRLASTSMKLTMDQSATRHGAALLERGYTVAQVVHDYGDVCQAITELAEELSAPITTDEFRTLNRCLDEAIAGAVTEFGRLRDQSAAHAETERSGVLAHELRNRISTAQLAFEAIAAGRAPVGGSVAAIVRRSLQRITALVDRSLVEVRLESGTIQRRPIRVDRLMEEAEVVATMEAVAHGVALSVAPTAGDIEVEADPQILAGAIANLLQNALKFTRRGGSVTVRTLTVDGRVEIEVEDECGGLPADKREELFGAFQQRGADRSGLGLGLFISRKGVHACGGVIRVRDLPGRGCVFTIALPRCAPSAPTGSGSLPV